MLDLFQQDIFERPAQHPCRRFELVSHLRAFPSPIHRQRVERLQTGVDLFAEFGRQILAEGLGQRRNQI